MQRDKRPLHEKLNDIAIARIERRQRLFKAARKLAPWVSASLSELKPGHTGEYEATVEEFLTALHEIKSTD